MGIHGWTRILAQEGWLDEASNNSNYSLWRIEKEILRDNLTRRIESIPPDADLHIDGNGLAFFIYRVAYARLVDRVLNKSNAASFKASSLSSSQARELLPTFCPLSLVHEVTNEFLSNLAKETTCLRNNTCRRKIKVYWDGDARYVFKNETDLARQSSVDQEWSNFQLYCLHGRIPFVDTICKWCDYFPKNRLFIVQVMHTIQHLDLASMIFCEEEADHIIAKAASGQRNAFVIGKDSDFCFFPDTNYVPMDTLDISIGNLTGIIIRRDHLADSLALPDEAAILELAILLGNDYINPAIAQLDGFEEISENKKNIIATDYTKIVDYLIDKGPGFRVTSINEETEETLRFIRTLYNFGDLQDFVYMKKASVKNDLQNPEQQLSKSIRPNIDNINLQPAVIQVLKDSSVMDAVIRCLKTYIDEDNVTDDKENKLISQSHLDVLLQLSMDKSENIAKKIISQNTIWRPEWNDVVASYVIEKVVSHTIKSSLMSPIVRLVPPFSLFDQYKFHALLQSLRISRTVENDVRETTVPLKLEESKVPEIPVRVPLPVDEFEELILSSVKRNRVTIIQGETGCGKSSRIPLMLMNAPSADPSMGVVKLFISQPRRIAAKALVEYIRTIEPTLNNQIALRMGHGVKEYETPSTRAWFVTTGYLVRLMANHPERFDSISYLIVDEVHERSVDTDILCLLCRRLLQTNPHIRLILMSATLAAKLYQDYFNVQESPIKVGARRFPVNEVYLEDICGKLQLPRREMDQSLSLIKECHRMKCSMSPSNTYMNNLYSIASHLATVVGAPGSSVLIFVPGMNDIIQITELIEKMYVPGITFTCHPIHSDIPFEDQMNVFLSPASDEVKIVIATNSAESSVTLPDVDNVICLGLCKQIIYNELSHRQMLVPTWISRASGDQRKGRTGRLRPGTVYRLYTREAFDQHMLSFEPGEMLRIPLDSVILMLKTMLPGENVTETLMKCLEPPDISTIERSFESLHQSHFITTPNDECSITTLGSFVSALGIDLFLGFLIGLGIQVGVGKEAIQLAAILSFPKTPWLMSNPLIHESKSYNDITVRTYVSRCHFDANLYSEPMSAMNLLFEYRQCQEKTKWCKYYGVFPPRIQRLESTYRNLRRRVADYIGIDNDLLNIESPPTHMPHEKITLLRIIQVWTFNETLIELQPNKMTTKYISDDQFKVVFGAKSAKVDHAHFKQILKIERHPFTLQSDVEYQQKGQFTIMQGIGFGLESFHTSLDFEGRLLSYASEKNVALVTVGFIDYFVVFVREVVLQSLGFASLSNRFTELFASIPLYANENTGNKTRGLRERSCGRWEVNTDNDVSKQQPTINWWKFPLMIRKTHEKDKRKSIEGQLNEYRKSYSTSSISFNLRRDIGSKKSLTGSFEISSRNFVGEKVTDVDLCDLFACKDVKHGKSGRSDGQQMISFLVTNNSPMQFNASARTDTDPFQSTSWDRPLIQCIPEGVRLLSVLASGRRKEHIVRLNTTDEEKKEDSELDESIDIHLDPSYTKISGRWKQLDSKKMVYVETNSVPASAVSLHGNDALYCTCANTLEVSGGGLKAEGLTLLPSGKLFYSLCKVTFGLIDEPEKFNSNKYSRSIADESSLSFGGFEKVRERIEKAYSYHQSSLSMGERLQCFPDKVVELLGIFDGVDGHNLTGWDGLRDDPFVPKNQMSSKKLVRQDVVKFNSDTEERNLQSRTVEENGNMMTALYLRKVLKDKKRKETVISDFVELRKVNRFDDKTLKISKFLFATSLPPGYTVRENELPSSNICSIIVQSVRSKLGIGTLNEMSLTDDEWEILSCDFLGRKWFCAKFNYLQLSYSQNRSEKLPLWIRKFDPRPDSIDDARACVPSSFSESLVRQVNIVPQMEGDILVFTSMEVAVRMELAFWLERQFRTAKLHWYEQHSIDDMIQRLYTQCKQDKKKHGT